MHAAAVVDFADDNNYEQPSGVVEMPLLCLLVMSSL